MRRQWRKLHLAVDADTGEIAAHVLTEGHVDDAAQAPTLLGQAEGMIASVIADGAYDGEPVYQAVAERQPDPPVAVVIPPRSTAVPGPAAGTALSQRDQHIGMIGDKGRMGWQKAVGYGRRSHAETAMARYKHLIGPKLRAELASSTGRGRHRRRGAEQDDPNGKARLRPGRLGSDRERTALTPHWSLQQRRSATNSSCSLIIPHNSAYSPFSICPQVLSRYVFPNVGRSRPSGPGRGP